MHEEIRKRIQKDFSIGIKSKYFLSSKIAICTNENKNKKVYGLLGMF